MNFDEQVKFFCVKICESLGQDPYEKVGYNKLFCNWQDHDSIVRDWLVTEAFSRIKSEYWNKDGRFKGDGIITVTENKNE